MMVMDIKSLIGLQYCTDIDGLEQSVAEHGSLLLRSTYCMSIAYY